MFLSEMKPDLQDSRVVLHKTVSSQNSDKEVPALINPSVLYLKDS